MGKDLKGDINLFYSGQAVCEGFGNAVTRLGERD